MKYILTEKFILNEVDGATEEIKSTIDAALLSQLTNGIENYTKTIDELREIPDSIKELDKFLNDNKNEIIKAIDQNSDDAKQVQIQINSINDKLKAGLGEAELAKDVSETKKIIQEILNKHNNTSATINNNNINWDEKFENTSDMKAFWDEYKNNIDWLKNNKNRQAFFDKITHAFEVEAKTYKSLDKRLNPFVYFLEKKVFENSNFETKFTSNAENYLYIHNAVSKSFITDEDLRGNGIFKEYNLIFNYAVGGLYDKDTDIINYLELQHDIANTKYTSSENLKKLNTALTRPASLLFNIFGIEGSDTFDKEITSSNYSLKSLTDIRIAIKETNIKLGIKLNKKNELSNKLINTLDEKEARQLLKFIQVLFTTGVIDGGDANSFKNNLKNNIGELDKVGYTTNDLNTITTKLQLDKFDLNDIDALSNLIPALGKKAGLLKQTEEH